MKHPVLYAQYIGIDGEMLWFDDGWHCWLKKSLKILTFSKSEISRGIKRTFLPLTKILVLTSTFLLIWMD